MRKIAIDYSWLGPTGIGRVASEVITRAPPDWQLTAVRDGRANAGPFTPLDLWLTLRRMHANLFWSPGFMPPVCRVSVPTVLTVHDLTHLHYYGRAKRTYYNAFIKALLSRVAHIVTVSDFTRHELLQWSGLPEEKVTMISNAVSPAFNHEGPSMGLPFPYILYAGNRRSYKNVEGLIKSFGMSKLAAQGYVLALTGNPSADLQQLAKQLKLEEHIHYFGFVSDKELPTLYRSAHALAFVSLYEGFGLPILEAMASGVPVVTSNLSSMPEVAGNAAVLVDPHDLTSIAAGLIEVSEDEAKRKELITKGLQRSATFSWDKTADKYWTLFSRFSN
ncbi:glycosyltransferase family 4 protein [Massilia forsythiae]|uniref:Glycosyltransferase family 4 protein n=1 Tax=Massilia forsythiae TaxID=2728020 RepID=A0A7Z2ZSV0_9BURK|nr:glycosyltransferase family 1 protein [Massilia forsythiae]QJE00898.1 glycosyltransferase family 4 protein [Massilia forsythiae]